MIRSKDTLFTSNYTLNCKGRIIDLSTPQIMGIVNLTKDSFYDGGKIKNDKDLLNQVEKHLSEGATFIDVGAFSSRPGAQSIDEQKELSILENTCGLIKSHFHESLLSVDTYRSSVSESVINNGCDIINDISGSSLDKNILSICGKYKVPYIGMHSAKNPFDHKIIETNRNITNDVLNYYLDLKQEALNSGIVDFIIDPGFGFSKTMNENFKLLKEMKSLKQINSPVLVGISRKRMIHQTLNSNPNEALNGTTALHMLALNNGANILRVHDVKEAKEVVVLHESYKNA